MCQLSAWSYYSCCIAEISIAMKMLLKPIKANRKALLQWPLIHLCKPAYQCLWYTIQKLLESSQKLVHLYWEKGCRYRHLNYSTEKAVIKDLVKTPFVHRCTKSHIKVIFLTLAGMLCLHFASCLHTKSHQLEQSWTVCSWHTAMQYLKRIND